MMVSHVVADVTEEVVQKHFWMGASRSSRSIGQCCVPRRFVFLYSGGIHQKVHVFELFTYSSMEIFCVYGSPSSLE